MLACKIKFTLVHRYDLPAVLVQRASMNLLNEFFWRRLAFRDEIDNIPIRLSVKAGDIVADADVASLECSIKAVQFGDDLMVQVMDAAPVDARALHSQQRYVISLQTGGHPVQFAGQCAERFLKKIAFLLDITQCYCPLN